MTKNHEQGAPGPERMTAGSKAVSARSLAGMLRSRIERAAENKSETVSLGRFFADQIHRYLTDAGYGPEHDARDGDVPADDGDTDRDHGRDWGLRARQVHLEGLSRRAADGKWFASTNGADGLARIDNGTDAMFPVRCEWHEAEFIEALVNAYRRGDLTTPAPATPPDVRALSEIRPDLGAPTREPSLREILIDYYQPWFSHQKSVELADRYIAALATHPAGQSAGSGAETIAVQKRDLVEMTAAAFAVDPSVPTEAQGNRLFAAANKLAGYLPSGLECTGCGSRESIESIQARGFVSCCPERKMQPAPVSTRTGDEGTEEAKPDPIRLMKEALFSCLSEGTHDRDYGGVLVAGGKKAWLRFSVVDAETSAALAARPASPEAQGAWITCDVLTMRLSDGRADYFTRIKCGGRDMTIFKFGERYKAQYSADEFAWLLGLRPDKPDLMAYDEASYPNVPAPPSSGPGGR